MKESPRPVIAILSTLALLIACTALPVLISRHFHPAAGCAVALTSLFVWIKLVRPTPGLVQGIVAISGVVAILGVLFVCGVHLFRTPPT